jgi:hypothetical protein
MSGIYNSVGWYLLYNNTSGISWTDIKTEWGIDSTDISIYRYIYKLASQPIDNGKVLTYTDWTQIDTDDTELFLNEKTSYWIYLTNIE